MGPVVCGMVGALLGAYTGFKGEWPAVTIFVFAGVGFALAYGLAFGILVRSLGGL
jgi:hypothetical protein